MTQPLPFTELITHQSFRRSFAAGDAMLVLCCDLQQVLWANPQGAALINATPETLRDHPAAQLTPQTSRQIQALDLSKSGLTGHIALRLGGGLSGAPLQCAITPLGDAQTLPFALLLTSAPSRIEPDAITAQLQALAQADSAHHYVLLETDGGIVGESDDFASLEIATSTLADLTIEALDSEQGLVQRRIRAGQHTLPASIMQLCESQPQRFLLMVEAQTPIVKSTSPVMPDDTALTADIVSAPDAAPVTEDIQQARFIWKVDEHSRFSEISTEFANIVGNNAADIIGRKFSDVAKVFGFDHDGTLAALLAKRETWSGKRIFWPVEGTDQRVPLDLAALPAFTRDRTFTGFSGFGVIYPQQAERDPEAIGLALTAIPAPQPDHQTTAQTITAQNPGDALKVGVTTAEPLTSEKVILLEALRAAQNRIPDGSKIDAAMTGPEDSATVTEMPSGSKPADSPEAPFPEAPFNVQRNARSDSGLSPTERSAFREIADRLRREVLNNQQSPKPVPAASESSDAQQIVQVTPPPAIDTPVPVVDTEAEAIKAAIIHAATHNKIDAANVDQLNTASASPVSSAKPAKAAVVVPYPHAEEPANLNADTDLPADTDQDSQAQDDLHMLSGLPVPVLIHSADRLHFANQAFFDMTGYTSLDDLQQAGGIDALFARDDEDDAGAETGMVLCLADGSRKAVDAHLQSVPWQGVRALMLSILPELVLRADNDDAADMDDHQVFAKSSNLTTQSNPVHHLQQELSDLSRRAETAPDMTAPTATTSDGSVSDTKDASLTAAAPRDIAPTAAAPQADLYALQTQIDELTSILDTATDGVVIIAQDGMIRSLNQSAAALFGYDSDDLTGKSFAVLFAIESQRAAIDYIHGLSGDGVASLLNDGREVIGREAQGRFIPLFMTIGRLPGSKGYCAVLRDITQWKRAEEELTSARQEAERASTHKTEFLARISHEIRTPLNAIIGFSELMADEKFGPIGNERYREYLRDIHRSGNHVLALVNDLLDISKIEAGALDLEFEAVALNDALAEAVALMQPQANRERVIIRSSFAAFLPDIVADARSIRQIAFNLLSNAIRFTGQGGQVIVSTAYEPQGEVVMRIRDTGIGMDSAELEQALKPFRQVASHNRRANREGSSSGDIKDRRNQGTGLGLPLTKAMVEANRAQFSIESNPGQGTVIEITFPPTRVLAE